MMEFTLARISAIVCGGMVVLILFGPVVSSYDDRAASEIEDNCAAAGKIFDKFMDSETEESFVDLGLILPDSNTVLSFSGRTMTVNNDRGSWNYTLRYDVEADSGVYTYGDYLLLQKSDSVLCVHRV